MNSVISCMAVTMILCTTLILTTSPVTAEIAHITDTAVTAPNVDEHNTNALYQHFVNDVKTITSLSDLQPFVTDAYFQQIINDRNTQAQLFDQSPESLNRFVVKKIQQKMACANIIPKHAKINDTVATTLSVRFDMCHSGPVGELYKHYWVKRNGQWLLDVERSELYWPTPFISAIDNKIPQL